MTETTGTIICMLAVIGAALLLGIFLIGCASISAVLSDFREYWKERTR